MLIGFVPIEEVIVPIDVIVLNGGSSSGKSGIVESLKEILPDPWINLGVGDLFDRLPSVLLGTAAGISFGPDGEVLVGDGWRTLETAWTTGVAAMARAGARIVIDDNFLGGGADQERLRGHLDGLRVLWAGVHCAPEVAEARELARFDRVPGMAVRQATAVHQGVVYDVEVDTTHATSRDCAEIIAGYVARTGGIKNGQGPATPA
ncbi:chloramphenicol phosphotransferase [Actinoplanes sp. NPDC051851]|uniref:chloramphenicol phosphotransferase CPT family protein n=1 Tax=Actinoplanes sp. NPDC051851 TaxID=3154753 RepID=UPI00344A44D8